MTPQDKIKAFLELAKKAAKGPWHHHISDKEGCLMAAVFSEHGELFNLDDNINAMPVPDDDVMTAQFIAQSRNLAPRHAEALLVLYEAAEAVTRPEWNAYGGDDTEARLKEALQKAREILQDD